MIIKMDLEKLLKFSNKNFEYCEIPYKPDENNLENYSGDISDHLQMKNKKFLFFYKGSKIDQIDENYFQHPKSIQVLDPEDFEQEFISFKILLENKVEFYKYSIRTSPQVSVKQALCSLISQYELKYFNSDFYFIFFDFLTIIDKPLGIFPKNDKPFSIVFLKEKQTKRITFIWNNHNKYFQVGLKTTLKEAAVKAQILFNICDRLITLKNWKNQVINEDLKIINLNPNENTFIIQEVGKIESPERGLIIEYECNNLDCPSYQIKKDKKYGLGIFDIKKIIWKIKCESCSKYSQFIDYGIKSSKAIFLGKKDHGRVNQTIDYDEAYRKPNLPISSYSYMTKICI